ncbi:MAG TPA: choice-of-anchor D domain-containing protein [Candidatus Solibacter sp.]|nr:choice-of-anchor D domain-containing protein [Candidatus Solibacter sp.]
MLGYSSPVRYAAVGSAIAVVVIATFAAVVARHDTPEVTAQGAAMSETGLTARLPLPLPVSPATRARTVENYGKLPLSFEANRGQSDQQVKFLSRGQGYTLFLTQDEAVMSLRRGPAPNFDRDKLAALKPDAFKATNESAAVLRMKLVGANPFAKVSGGGEQEGKSNYFIGNDPQDWQTNVSNYSSVRYDSAYPGIDLVYYGNQQQLEYDFVVAPGASPKQISLDIAADSASRRSSTPLRVADNGDLLVPTEGGEVRFHKPIVYQPENSADVHSIGGNRGALVAKNSVDARWVLKAGNRVGFEVPSYDASRPLIIDPVLSYSTYIGGTGTDGAFGVAIDSQGNCYVTGFTTSTNFPTKNPIQKKLAGGVDTFVLKLNRMGNALVYSTYIGGSGTEYPFGIAVDSAGEAYELGNTGSANFPTTAGALQTTCASCNNFPDVFLTKLNAAGSALVYSTFLGGSGDDRAFGITLDAANNAYIVGWTTSIDFPTTATAFQTVNNGGISDAFVAEVSADGSTLVYSTYLGGSGQDVGFGIAVDAAGNTFATGYSYSLDFPTTAGAFQTTTTVNGAAWITKLTVGGVSEIYSTFLGGTTGTSASNSIKVDSNENAYVTGYTCASDFPVTAGVVQSTFGGDCTNAGGDGFVTVMDPGGDAPVFSTYLGGTGDDVGFSIGLDQSNNIYITGRSSSPNYPTTPGAFQRTMAGGYDTIFSILNPTGTQLIYSTYLGGNAVDVAFVMAVDSVGNSYIIGRTYSKNFPVTPGALQSTLKGSTNAIVYKFGLGDQAWPMQLNYGSVAVANTSNALTTTLTNSGTSSLALTGQSLTGTAATDYSITNNTCGASLDPGTSCAVSLTFTPSTTGTRSALLAFADAAQNSPQNVALMGVGSTSAITLTPASLAYATQLINTTSASQPATLTNTGTTDITITNIATTGPFSQTNNCPATLTAGTNCVINVVFTPNKPGTLTGTLAVTDSGPNSPQQVALTGVGTVVSYNPTSLSFGNQAKGTSSQPQNIVLTNNGPAPIAITKIFISGSRVTSFSETNNCPISPATLTAGSSCTISATFTPQLKGALNANVTVQDTGGGSPQNVPMSGNGT